MPDSTPKDSNEEPTKDSIDLSDLKSFSFGTQWTAASKSSSDSSNSRFERGGPRGGDRPNRRPGASGPPRKDRRPPRTSRPEGGAGEQQPRQEHAGQSPAGGQGDQQRRQFRRGGRQDAPRVPFQPYESPIFDICFYPDDNCFSAIIKAMRGNHLTYELFQVAKLFMEKPDRFIASVTRKAAEGQKSEKVFICALDNMPFASEEEVISHVMAHHAADFFTIEEVEVDPPSGNFPFVCRCPFTKVLLGPPNYHKYEAALRNHHLTRLPNMSFEKLQGSIETVREEEVVAEWLEGQKKATRYTVKDVAEGTEAVVFLSAEAATNHLRGDVKAKIVKAVNYARVSGHILEQHPTSEAFKAMDGERQRQQRFPLDTANAIRGRMRREKFSIYKKGAKGVTYVCATKRNFRTPGQVMSPDLDRIIRFLEANQGVKAKEVLPIYEAWLKAEGVETAADEKKVQRDLHWLIADGYVSHFEDDTLFAQPVLDSGAAKPKGEEKAKGERAKSESPAKAKKAGVAVEGEAVAEEIAAEEPEAEIDTPEEVAEAEVEPSEVVVETEAEVAEVAVAAEVEVTTVAEAEPVETKAEEPAAEVEVEAAEPVAEVEPVAEAEVASSEPEAETEVASSEREAETGDSEEDANQAEKA